MVTLTKREKEILKLVIEDFVESGVPVSSSSLCEHYNLQLSSATIRNVMMKLEREGLLYQPHISAGRIPTDTGYRIYVDRLMSVEPISSKERNKVLNDLRSVSKDFHQMLEKSSILLGEISNQLGIVFMPKMFDGVFLKLELVPISDRRILLVISIKSGLFKTIVLELDFDITRKVLELTAQILNERLSGLTLGEIRNTIDKRLNSVSIKHPELISYFKNSVDDLFDFDNWDDYYFGGTSNILNQNEFATTESVGTLMELLENKKNIIQLFGNFRKSQTHCVTIGTENTLPKLDHFSFVARDYNYGNVKGILGIIGPTRMHYPRMVSIVNYVSNTISKFAPNRLSSLN